MELIAKPQTSIYTDFYQDVTDSVIKALEEGTVIWQCSWNQVGFPKNATTNINYRGWNVFWLNFHTMLKSYLTPYYITFKQAQKLGGRIKKGEKGTKITYWATIELKNEVAESPVEMNGNQDTPKTRMVPKTYTVFNIDQTEGIEFPKVEQMVKTDAQKIAACEKIIEEMPTRPSINFNGNSAYYNPESDTVVVPALTISTSSEGYYSTLFHELAHSTGHTSRLNRKELVESDGFGNENYAKEELIAEMTAAFLCAVTGINQTTIDNSAAYIQGWLRALRNDKKLILKAAAQAQRAADYILEVTYEPA